MITNWFTLQKCANYFNEQYASSVLDKCITFEKNELWLLFREKPSLKIHLGQPFQYILQSSHPMKINKSSIRIFPALEGAITDKIEMLPDERIMKISFTNTSCIYIAFLSNRGNIAYVSGDKMELFKKKIPVDIPETTHQDTYRSLDEDPRFSPFWKRNAFDMFGVDSYQDIIRIIDGSNGLEVNDRFVLTQTDQNYNPTVFYTNYRQFVITHLQEDHFHSDYKQLENLITSKLDDLQRKIRDTKNDGKIEKRVETYKYYASVLSASRHLITDRSDSFTVPDMYRMEGFPTEIPLKNDVSISENIDLFYKKARSAANSIEENAKRHQSFLKDFEIWEKLYQGLHEIKDSRALRDRKKSNKNILKNSLLPTPYSHTSSKKRGTNDESTRRPYKEYTRDGWRIQVGRSARDNDDLTFKHASKTDVWLHTRHSTGSHVIIKRDGRKDIPGYILEYAASLAARYSDEKHSSLVTVVSTERKYVTKRKGMPPGKVHFQYEKDLMIKPAEI